MRRFKERYEELSDQEKKVIDLVVKSFGKYSGKVLEKIPIMKLHGKMPEMYVREHFSSHR